jgi:iron(III) transport system permease protein
MIVILPVAYLMIGSFYLKVGGVSLTFPQFLNTITSQQTASLLSTTLLLALGNAAVAILVGTVYTWIIVRTDIPGKRLFDTLSVLPLTMPFLVKAFSWILVFSPQIGLGNIAFESITGLDGPFNIYTFEGLIFAMSLGAIPIVYLTLKPVIMSVDPSLEEASRIAGKGVLKTLFRVTFPVILPAMLSAFVLVTVFGLGNFDYPLMLGGNNIKTLATEVYYLLFHQLPPAYGQAAAIGIIYLVMTLAAITFYLYFTRKAYKFVVVTGKAPRPTLYKLGKWKHFAFAVCFTVLFLGFILPFGGLVLMSLASSYTVYGHNVIVTWSIDNYVKALNLPMFFNAVTNTVVLGFASAVIATLLAALLAYAALKSRVRGARLIEYISAIPLAFPGIIYGLALFWTFLFLPGISDLLYGTVWPLVMALVVIRLPYSVRMISGSLMQISDDLEAAARVAGASRLRSLRRVILPLLKSGLLNSFEYTFINSLRELGAVILLVTPGTIVLTSLLLNLYSQHASALGIVAAASVMLCVMIMLVLLLVPLFQRLMSWGNRVIASRRKEPLEKT